MDRGSSIYLKSSQTGTCLHLWVDIYITNTIIVQKKQEDNKHDGYLCGAIALANNELYIQALTPTRKPRRIEHSTYYVVVHLIMNVEIVLILIQILLINQKQLKYLLKSLPNFPLQNSLKTDAGLHFNFQFFNCGLISLFFLPFIEACV